MNIAPLDRQFQHQIQDKINNKTKPVGALGQLEALAMQLATIQSQNRCNPVEHIKLAKPIMLVFAGDHGINQHDLSIAPSSVTGQMVMNFLQGGAAINCFCRTADIELNVIDCGILQVIETGDGGSESPMLVNQRLGCGTNDFSQQSAMDLSQVTQGFLFAQQLVERLVDQKRSVILLGEMGIANTSSAAALFCALTNNDLEQCVGKGTGIDEQQFERKIQLIKMALARVANQTSEHTDSTLRVKQILSELGGFEIVQMVGTILAAAKAKLTIVIDGFIVSVAALAAITIDKNVQDYLIFSHVSPEQGHQLLLNGLKATPLLSLELRLGEGTGAALAFSLIQSAACFYNDMASFESAGVSV